MTAMLSTVKPYRQRQQLISEADFTNQILQWAKVYGWRRFHVRSSGRMSNGHAIPTVQGDAGFPDLVLCKPPRIIFAELKVGKNFVSQRQQWWLTQLANCSVEVYEWHPKQWSEILHQLSKP